MSGCRQIVAACQMSPVQCINCRPGLHAKSDLGVDGLPYTSVNANLHICLPLPAHQAAQNPRCSPHAGLLHSCRPMALVGCMTDSSCAVYQLQAMPACMQFLSQAPPVQCIDCRAGLHAKSESGVGGLPHTAGNADLHVCWLWSAYPAAPKSALSYMVTVPCANKYGLLELHALCNCL